MPGHNQKFPLVRHPTIPELHEPQTTCSPTPVLRAGRKAVVPTLDREDSLPHIIHAPEVAALGLSKDTCLS